MMEGTECSLTSPQWHFPKSIDFLQIQVLLQAAPSKNIVMVASKINASSLTFGDQKNNSGAFYISR